LLEAVQILENIDVNVHVIVPSDGLLVQKLRGTNATIHFLSTPWWVKEFRGHSNIVARLYEYVKAVLKLVGIIKALKPDVLITNTIVVPCGAFASKLVGIPHIWYIREFLEEDHGWKFEFGRLFSISCINYLSLRVIANSEAVRKKFTDRILPSKISVIYNAVNIEKANSSFSPIEKQDGTFYVALVGRKSPGKGQKEAIEAIEILLKAQQKIHLWLVGDEFENYAEELKTYVKRLGIDDAISFIPFVENPLQFMIAADVVLVCSRCEAFGRVTIEAMKLGKAVIGSNSGSMPELIRDRWNGLLYRASSPHSLAEKISILSKNRDLRKAIEANAYQWANSKFTCKIYSSDLMNLIKEVTRG
jgi:glycosyltransferase involved in cell wall biosynthesis